LNDCTIEVKELFCIHPNNIYKKKKILISTIELFFLY